MIVIYDAAGAKHPLSGYTNYHIRHMADGEDRLSFYLDTSHEQYQLIREEGKIEAEGNDYLVKKIDNNKIDCVLDFDFLKARTYTDYRSETRTLLDVLTDHLPEGWTIEGAEVSTIRRTISFDACTDYDIISQCQKTYSVRFIWHIQDKRLEVIDPDQITPTGEYITSELNLQSLSFKGETTSFATRLYAYGADGMTMEDAIVDGERYGKTYVENHEFSDKVVCAVWKDERYTIPANLFNDATEKLALLAKPVRSYKCRVLDLAKQDPRYSFLTFSMWRKITLIDVERKLRVEHQIVQYDEYPEEPDRNDVTLSCVPETIHDRIKATAAITEDGKAKIFVTQPAPPYDIGDLWVQGPDGEIMRCRIKRTAGEAFDLDDWILASKYTDDTYAEAVQADLDQYKIDVSATLEVHEENIEARVTKTGGESSSFAWIMTDAAHTWYANSAPVMAVSKDGLTVNGNGTFTGEIRASKGYIGGATGFEITSQAIRNGMESRDDTEHNGVYIGTSGIALGGGKFKVTSTGAVTAKSLDLTGGSIRLGDDGNGNPVFAVTNQGAVTAKNLTLTGGSINIGDKFKVSTTGVLTADMTGGSITLGDNFAVTNQGAVTAKNLTLTGGSISLGSDTDGNPVFRVTNQGAVTAKNLTLTGGSINIGDKFKVSSTGVLTADMTGGSITLGNNFAVTNSGAVTAKDLTLTGGSISLGSDGSGNPVFNVTSSGAVTARNLALTGGSINIKDENGETAFSVSSTGAVTASKLSITGGSISIGNAFSVDEEGNIRASSGYFGGSVLAENIKSDAVHGEGGSLSGSALTTGTVTGGVNGSGHATGQLSAGVVASLGYANAYNSATQVNTGTYPAQFTAGGVYGNFLFVKAGGQGAYRDIAAHTHEFTEGTGANAGKVFIGAADLTGAEHSFKIADTKYYKDGVSAAWDEGAETAQVDTVSITANGIHIKSGSHHYTRTTVKATAKGTKADGSIYKAAEQTISTERDVNADVVYTAGKTDYEPTSILVTRETADADISWNATQKKLSANFTITAKNAAGIAVLDSTGKSISIPAAKAFDAGQDYGAGTVVVLGTDSLTVTTKNAHKTSGQHHYVNVDVIPTARATKSDGTYATATNTINRDINADTVYSDGVSAGYNSGVETAAVDAVSTSSNDDHETSGSHHYVTIDITANAKGTYYNGSKYTAGSQSIASGRYILADAVYSAGYTAGAGSVSQRDISSVDEASYSTSADFSVVFDDAYLRYTNGYLRGRASIALTDGSSSTVFIEMDGNRAYNSGHSDGYSDGHSDGYSEGYRDGAGSVSQRTISSIGQTSYSSNADFSFAFDYAYLRYSDGFLKGRASISFSDGSSNNVFIEMDGARAYDTGKSDGYSEGYTNGHSDGYSDGWSAKSFYFAGVSGTYSDTEILLYVYENGNFVTSYWVPYQGTFD